MSRLSRVTDSIASKNEKLRLINEANTRQRLVIEELSKHIFDLRSKENYITNQINEELATKKRHEDRNSHLTRELDNKKKQIIDSSKQQQALMEVSKECFVLMLLENDQMETHSNVLNAVICVARDRSLMSHEDLLSTLRMRNEISRSAASSTRVETLKRQLRSVRMKRREIDQSLL